MRTSWIVVTACALAAAPSQAWAQPSSSGLRTVTYTRNLDMGPPPGRSGPTESITLDFSTHSFRRVRTNGRETTGRIVGSLQAQLEGILAQPGASGTETLHVRELGSWHSWDVTIERNAPGPTTVLTEAQAPFADKLEHTLTRALLFTGPEWKVVGGTEDDMTRYFDEAPRDWFPESVFSPPKEDEATVHRRVGLEVAATMWVLTHNFSVTIGEVGKFFAATFAPDAFNRREMEDMLHSLTKNTLNGDVSTERINKRIAELKAESLARESATIRAREGERSGAELARDRGAGRPSETDGVLGALGDRVRDATKTDRAGER